MARKKSKKAQTDENIEVEAMPKNEETDIKSKLPESDKITFDAWFGLTIGPKNAWLRDSLKSFMESQGLKEAEEKKKFDKAYSKF